MRIVGIAWYLFGLMCVAAIIESLITYVPSAQHFAAVTFSIIIALIGAFGLAAAWLTVLRRRLPDSPILQSRALLFAARSVAAIMTLILIVCVIG
jgi:hypothetical protein